VVEYVPRSASVTIRQLLLGDRLAPITSEIGFIEGPIARVVEAFIAWQAPLQLGGVTLTSHQVSGDLETALRSLLPLTSDERRRYLFTPTRSRWVAYFDNGHRGTDVFSAISYLARTIKVNAVRVMAIPNTIESNVGQAKGRYGGLMLEVYGPQRGHFLNIQRSVGLINDGGRWRFDANGPPFPFEKTDRYAAKSTKERFSFADLVEYLDAFEIRAFSDNFYEVSDAQLILKNGPALPDSRAYTLEEARRDF
jgi:hypothetical protein